MAFIRYPLLMTPHLAERRWGGTRLAELGKDLEGRAEIGEAWEVSDHPHGLSKIGNGPYKGSSFGELFAYQGREMCAIRRVPKRFPLLVKYLDAKEHLSVQVHPSDGTAPPGERGKSECWYILDCEKDARIIHGLGAGVEPAQLAAAARNDSIRDLLLEHPIRKGSFIGVPPGIVHAIMGGTLLCEIQQSSDTTYRLWDWGRSPRREMHVDEAVKVAEYGVHGEGDSSHFQDTLEAGGETKLLSNPFFSVELRDWPADSGKGDWTFANDHGVIVNVVQGTGEWSCDAASERLGRGEFALGQTWFISAGLSEFEVSAGRGGLRVLLTRSVELE